MLKFETSRFPDKDVKLNVHSAHSSSTKITTNELVPNTTQMDKTRNKSAALSKTEGSAASRA